MRAWMEMPVARALVRPVSIDAMALPVNNVMPLANGMSLLVPKGNDAWPTVKPFLVERHALPVNLDVTGILEKRVQRLENGKLSRVPKDRLVFRLTERRCASRYNRVARLAAIAVLRALAKPVLVMACGQPSRVMGRPAAMTHREM